MRRVYQRRSRLAGAAAAAAMALAVAACSPPAGTPDAAPVAITDPDLLFLTVDHELVGLADDGARAIADRRGPAGVEAVAVALDGGRIEPLAPGRAGESRALSPAPTGGRLLLELAGAGDERPILWLREPAGALLELPPPRPASERFVGWLRAGAALATAGARAPGEPESLFEIDPVGRSRRELARGEPGFHAATVDGDGRRVAWVRSLHDEADEVVVLDRTDGESRLVLPTRADGRFAPQAFAADGSLLLIADDGTEWPRLERLELATGKRRVLAAPRCAISAARHEAGGITADLICGGRRELLRLDPEGRPLAPPATASGTRPVAVAGDRQGAPAVLGVVGPTWPAELVAVDRHGLSRPLTYGLAPRLPPAAIAAPEPLGVRAGNVELPCELWHDAAGKYAGRAGVAWLEDDSRPPRYGELEPLFAALAARGVAVLRCHGRGTDGFGRRLRLAADGNRTGAALADCDAALAALRGRLPRAAPIALAGEGAWRGAAALAFAGRAPAGIARVLALFPAADPLAPLDALAAAGEPARSRGVAAWGDPESAGLLRARAAWAAALESARTPTWVVTGKRPLAGELAAERVSAAATAGAPVELLVAERSRLGGELLATAANELAERLATELARGSRTPPERR